jgi:hypothetical protein
LYDYYGNKINWVVLYTLRSCLGTRLAPTRSSKGFCTLNLEDEDILYTFSNVL